MKLAELKVNLVKIKEIRKQKGFTIEEMSRLLGYESLNGYYYLETGRGKFPAETLAKVANLLEVSIDHLFFEE